MAEGNLVVKLPKLYTDDKAEARKLRRRVRRGKIGSEKMQVRDKVGKS